MTDLTEDERHRLLVIHKNKEQFLIDMKVYDNNRNFRLYLSHKFGKSTLLRINRTLLNQPFIEDEEYIFRKSLVTDVPNGGHVIRTDNWQPSVNVNKTISSDRNIVVPRQSSPFNEIDTVISKLVTPGYIAYWKFYKDKDMYMYYIRGKRFCHLVNREHSSNHIYYLFFTKPLLLRQGCFACDSFFDIDFDKNVFSWLIDMEPWTI